MSHVLNTKAAEMKFLPAQTSTNEAQTNNIILWWMYSEAAQTKPAASRRYNCIAIN